MNPLSPFRMGDVKRAAGHRGLLVVVAFLLLIVPCLQAQVGSNNPTRVSGIFNGQVNTGCSYDPYTGNARRSITDIAVAGAVGEYPLALVRTYNSRGGTGGFGGFAPGWTHNYGWQIENTASQNHQFTPNNYTVDYPDGRKVTFAYAAGDPYYRGPLGVRERLIPVDQTTGLVNLILPDGGKVEFNAAEMDSGGDNNEIWWWQYSATALIDPYGQRTTFTYNANGLKVTEPGGRYLQFYSSAGMVDHVQASDGRTVQYYYINSAYSPGTTVYTVLDHVVYYGQSQWTAHYNYKAPNVGSANGIPLLWTCDDPMYPGPMHKIGYVYRTANNYTGNQAVYGQISSENYFDGTNVGAAVTTLTVPSATTRTETRADTKTRTFTYTAAGYLTSWTDFLNHGASQTYDANKWANSITDRNTHMTNFTRDPFTGNPTQIQYPLTQGDTPGQSQRPTVNYRYGWASCADPNNRDANNPYYVCTATDEGGHVTQFNRDANKRIISIVYPDGGWESFTYNSFGQVLAHRMTTTGTETFTYDGRGLKQTYSDPYHSNNNPASIRYYYDTLDRVNGIYDSLYNPTNWTYNDRGQVLVTTLATDPVDNQRHTITNAYNPDGTLQTTTDQLNHVTSYTYDDYRRLKSVTTPVRGLGDNGTYTTHSYYDANGTGDDYRFADSNVTWVVFPSGKKTNTVYDDNRRKSSVTVGYGTSDAATTSYTYDAVGNVTWVTNPRSVNTAFFYDERNRPREVHDVYGNITYFQYDTGGRRKKVIRPNTQTVAYDTFDNMNRVTQQTVTQAPNAAAVTKYTYYPSGLVNTMTDPLNSTDSYSYIYDLMGRKAWVTYPFDSSNPPGHRVEGFTYDDAGRLDTFRNRNGNYQTFHYDALNRMTYFTWDDNLTPRADFGYDAASRLTTINNANASISRQYYNDGLMLKEIEQITGVVARQVAYTYDEDGNRATTGYPGYTFNYTYTARNQLKTVAYYGDTYATYDYDENGNLTTRTLNNGTHTDYAYDALDRVTWVTHSFGRWFNYGYDNVSGNRTWAKRWNGQATVGEVFRYDLADQTIGVQLNVPNPDQVQQPIPWTIAYDANGNRTNFHPYAGTTDVYTTNDLSEYTQRMRNGTPASAVYNFNGDVMTGVDGSVCTYDAQNRVVSARKNNGPTMTFTYDGLNRQVSRTVNGDTTYNVWDGWDLIEEINAGGPIRQAYVYGAGGLITDFIPGVQMNYYYQDGSGSTSHVTDDNGNLKEWYRYDLQGTPIVNDDPNNHASAFGVRHLFAGQRWYSEVGLYDLRNRFYSPDIGRFLQADPIGFRGDRTNLYRYCGNNPVTRWDPSGLDFPPNEVELGRVTVPGDPIQQGWAPGGVLGGGNPIGGGSGEPGFAGRNNSDNPRDHLPITPPEDIPIPLPPPIPQIPALQDSNTTPESSSGSPTQAQITFQVLQAVVVTFPFGGQYMPMTPIKNSIQARQLGRHRGSMLPIFVPAGVNPQGIIANWSASAILFPFNLPAFGAAFMPGGMYDFKLAIRGGGPIYDSLGNFLYGASGWEAGISESTLQGMGDMIHGGLNDPVNVFDIQLGIDAVKMGGTISVVPVDLSDF